MAENQEYNAENLNAEDISTEDMDEVSGGKRSRMTSIRVCPRCGGSDMCVRANKIICTFCGHSEPR